MHPRQRVVTCPGPELTSGFTRYCRFRGLRLMKCTRQHGLRRSPPPPASPPWHACSRLLPSPQRTRTPWLSSSEFCLFLNAVSCGSPSTGTPATSALKQPAQTEQHNTPLLRHACWPTERLLTCIRRVPAPRPPANGQSPVLGVTERVAFADWLLSRRNLNSGLSWLDRIFLFGFDEYSIVWTSHSLHCLHLLKDILFALSVGNDE